MTDSGSRFLDSGERLLSLSPILTERGLAMAAAAELRVPFAQVIDKALPIAPKLKRKRNAGIETLRFWNQVRSDSAE